MHIIDIQVIRTSMSLLSCLASTTIATMIFRSENGLQNSFSRIIFGLSISDIMASASIIAMAPAVPRGQFSNAPWAIGTPGSCQGVMFILVLASFTVLWYTVLLTFYFLRRVKYSMTSQEFKQKYEVKMHVIIWSTAFSLALFGLLQQIFTSGDAFGEPVCTIGDFPVGCSVDPDTPCVRGQHYLIDTILIVVMPTGLSTLSLVVILARLTSHVHHQEKLYQSVPQVETKQQSSTSTTLASTASETVPASTTTDATFASTSTDVDATPASAGRDDEEDPSSSFLPKFMSCGCSKASQGQGTDGLYQPSLGSLAKESLVQSILYVLAFAACYVFPVVLYFISSTTSGKAVNILYFVGSSIFWPLGGFFNILVYTRPKIKKFRRLNPEYTNFPWIFIFLAVVWYGGESPEVYCQEQDQPSGLRVGRRDGVAESEAFPANAIDLKPIPFGGTMSKRDAPKLTRYTTPFVNNVPLGRPIPCGGIIPKRDTPKLTRYTAPFVNGVPLERDHTSKRTQNTSETKTRLQI